MRKKFKLFIVVCIIVSKFFSIFGLQFENTEFKPQEKEFNKLITTSTNLTPVTPEQNIVNIEDVNLLKAINKSLGKGEDITTPVSRRDMDKLVILRGENCNISNLSGLENSVNLQEIYLGNNNISNISVLGNSEKVKIVELQNNKIENINCFQKLNLITKLNLANNNITDIKSLKKLKKLSILNISNNKINENEFVNFTELGEINLANNNISEELLVESGAPEISIIANDNKISSVKTNNLAVNKLNLENNKLTSFGDVKKINAIKELNINNNKFQTLDGIEKYWEMLTVLKADNNKISEYDGDKYYFLNLIELSLKNNKLTGKARFKYLYNIRKINLSNCGIGNEVFSDICKEIAIGGKFIDVDLSGNEIDDISPIEITRDYVGEDVRGNRFHAGDTRYKGIENFNLDRNHISNTNFQSDALEVCAKNISINDQTIIKDVVLDYNDAKVNLKDLIKLKGICSITEVTDISNSGERTGDILKWNTNDNKQSFKFKAELPDSPSGIKQGKFSGTYILNIRNKASIKGAEDILLDINSKFDPKNGVYIEDLSKFNNNSLVVEGNVDTSKPGKYILTYKYTNQKGDETIVTRTVRVAPPNTVRMNIPDKNLRKGLNNLLGYGEISSELTDKDLEILTGNIDLSKKEIVDLEGIQHIKNLNSINLSRNNIEEIHAIQSLNNIEKIDLSNNKLKSSSIETLKTIKNLNEINLNENNELKDIDELNKLQNLKKLFIRNCGLTDIGMWAYTSIQEIDAGENALSDLEGVKNATELERLTISNANIEDISNISELKKLKYLKADECGIKIVGDLRRSSLEELHLCNNLISNVNGLNDMPNLKILDLTNNKVEDLTEGFSGLGSLDTLQISSNKIHTIGILSDKIPRISSLDLNNNEISDLNNLSELKSVKYLNISSNKIEKLNDINFEKMTNLDKLDVANNKIKDITALSKVRSFNYLNLSNNNIYDLGPLYYVYYDMSNFKATNQEITAEPLRVVEDENAVFHDIVVSTGSAPPRFITDISNAGTYNENTREITWNSLKTEGTQEYKFSNGDASFTGTVKVPIKINLRPIITAFDKNLFLEDLVDDTALLNSVYGYDVDDGIITDKVKVIENNTEVDSESKANKVGKYKVKYSLTDSEGAETTKEINVTVRPDVSPRIIGADNMILRVGESIDLNNGINATDDKDTSEDLMKTLKIESDLDTATSGIYSVKYSITDSTNNTTEHIRVINVVEDPSFMISIPTGINLGELDDETSSSYDAKLDPNSPNYDKHLTTKNPIADGIVGAKVAVSILNSSKINGKVKIYTDSEFRISNLNNKEEVARVNVYKTFTQNFDGEAESKSNVLLELDNNQNKGGFILKSNLSEFKTPHVKYEGNLNFVFEQSDQ